MLKRVGQILIIIGVLEFIAGLFYFLIAIPTADLPRIVIGLTHFAESVLFYLAGVYLTVYNAKERIIDEVE